MTARRPGVSISTPPPASVCSSRWVVVCRPLPSRRTSAVAATSSPDESVDERALARARAPEQHGRRAREPRAQLVDALAGVDAQRQHRRAERGRLRLGTAAPDRDRHRPWSATTSGVAPLSQATSRKRSRRRAENGWSSAFATTTSRRSRPRSGDERGVARHAALEQRAAFEHCRQAALVVGDEPVADRQTRSVATRRSPPAARSVAWPRSTRTTRAAAERSCPSSASSVVRRSSQPSWASAAQVGQRGSPTG